MDFLYSRDLLTVFLLHLLTHPIRVSATRVPSDEQRTEDHHSPSSLSSPEGRALRARRCGTRWGGWEWWSLRVPLRGPIGPVTERSGATFQPVGLAMLAQCRKTDTEPTGQEFPNVDSGATTPQESPALSH